jgi:hypothetical protein
MLIQLITKALAIYRFTTPHGSCAASVCFTSGRPLPWEWRRGRNVHGEGYARYVPGHPATIRLLNKF